MQNEFELHPDRLSTTDEQGKRVFLYPADVRGFFRKQRTRMQVVLIALFLFLPWIKIDGRQALLLDVAHRRFEIFGLSLRAHNAPLLIFVFASAAFALFFATAVFGRVWCGWACPQTVFIDGVYRRIERWLEGPALERRKLSKAPMSLNKFFIKSTKWCLYLATTLVLTHSFLAYFVGTDQLAIMMQHRPSENWGSFLFMAILSGIILFDFAWFREQFCTIVCPYGRFQSVLMDKGSMIVAYDSKRGEPRHNPENKENAKLNASRLGDCVNCYRCVQVCPTGIDIRRGVQLECIACTACIDACDDVMTKTKKPVGLIRYDSLVAMEGKKKKITTRAILYFTLFSFSVISLFTALYFIKPVSIEVLRAKESPYTTETLSSGDVMVTNHLKFELSNQSGAEHSLVFLVDGNGADQNIQLVTAVQPLLLPDGKVTQVDVFFRFPKKELFNGNKKIQILVKDTNTKTNQTLEVKKEVALVGPF